MPTKVKLNFQGVEDGFKVFVLSPLRTQYKKDDDSVVGLFIQDQPWFGECVHTCGSGVLDKAKEWGWTNAEVACYFYSQLSMGCPHEVIDGDGTVYVIVAGARVAVHCGAQGWMRNAMLDGSWKERVSAIGLKHWQARWPGVKSPQHLFPGSSGNKAYRGTELIPQPDKTFTAAQYESLAKRLVLRSRQNGNVLLHPREPLTRASNKLVGHEDLIPFNTAQQGRWDSKGGWDPGALRDEPRFDWPRLYSLIYQLQAA